MAASLPACTWISVFVGGDGDDGTLLTGLGGGQITIRRV
jgi:hypothetical protein